MPAGRVAMRRVREVLRLGFGGISKHEIARRTGLAASTVRETIARFKATGLDWPLPDTVNDSELEAKLYKNAGTKQGHRRHAEPDWAGNRIERETRPSGGHYCWPRIGVQYLHAETHPRDASGS